MHPDNSFQHWIEQQLATAPALTDEQRRRIARVLSLHATSGGTR